MNARRLLAATLGLSVAWAGLAAAAPRQARKPVCRLVTDAKGDQQVATANHYPVKGEPWSSDFDLLSADVATNGKEITAVVRLATLRSVTADPSSPSARYSLEFTAARDRFTMIAFVGVDGSSGIVTRDLGFTGDENTVGAGSAEGIGNLEVVVDEDRAEVRMTGPLTHFAPYVTLSRPTRLSALRAWSMQFVGKGGTTRAYPVPGMDFGAVVGGGGAASSTDRADSKATYVTGTRSCVTVGG